MTPPPAPTQQATAPAVDLFSADLKVLSRRLGVAFVAEGEPFPVTKEGPVPSLNEDLAQEDAVREVADYFDYSVVRQGKVYLLTKRYTNPADPPDVTAEECMLGLRTITRALASFNPKVPPATSAGSPQLNIVRMLSAEQLQELGKDGLLVSELTAPQREEVERLAAHFYLQLDADRIEESFGALENRNPADPVFHWKTVMEIHAFGYDTRSVTLNNTVFIPVSNSNRFGVQPDGTIFFPGASIHNGIPDRKTDPTDPGVLPDTTKRFLEEKAKPSPVVTLAAAIAALNSSAPGGGAAYKVDPIYASKHVTLVGTEKLSPSVQIHALAAVYGLRILQDAQDRLVITHPRFVDANHISDVSPAIKSAIPAPILRAIQALLPSTLADQKALRGHPSPFPFQDRMDKALAIRNTALQLFRYIAETAAKSQPKEKIALSHLGERAGNLFGIAATVKMFSQAYSLADRPFPPYISKFDQVLLQGGGSRNTDGADRFSLTLSYPDPTTGKMQMGIMLTNGIVP